VPGATSVLTGRARQTGDDVGQPSYAVAVRRDYWYPEHTGKMEHVAFQAGRTRISAPPLARRSATRRRGTRRLGTWRLRLPGSWHMQILPLLGCRSGGRAREPLAAAHQARSPTDIKGAG
jgi:hypothetical protein